MATNKKTLRRKSIGTTTTVGALSRTGPSVHRNPTAKGGKLIRIKRKK